MEPETGDKQWIVELHPMEPNVPLQARGPLPGHTLIAINKQDDKILLRTNLHNIAWNSDTAVRQ